MADDGGGKAPMGLSGCRLLSADICPVVGTWLLHWKKCVVDQLPSTSRPSVVMGPDVVAGPEAVMDPNSITGPSLLTGSPPFHVRMGWHDLIGFGAKMLGKTDEELDC